MSGPNTRKRTIVLKDDPVFYDRRSPTFPPVNGRVRLTGTQITTSEGHPWGTYNRFPGEDVGGAFRTERTYYNDWRGDPKKGLSPSPMFALGPYQNTGGIYRGPGWPELPTSLPFPSSAESSDDELAGWGTKAIALCKPTNSIADLSVALGELMREGLPSILGTAAMESRLRDIRAAGSEYLNVQFGWLPLISDLNKTIEAVSESDKIMKQYIRDAGRLVRRGYEFDKVINQTPVTLVRTDAVPNFGGLSTNNTSNGYAWFIDYPNHRRPLYSETKTEIRRWFKGAFTYYLPDGYDAKNKWDVLALKANKLYGLGLTPEVLWNLTPWSWAADWFGNYGDVLSNVSDYLQDGLVMPYGYMMEHSIVTTTYTMPDVRLRGYGSQAFTLSLSREVKKRIRATPYGFGLTFNSFSTRQKAILAALGITRVR